MFGWAIEIDHITYPGDEYDVTGHRFGTIPDDVKGVRFVLYDDDGERYYSGRFYTDNPDGITEEETYVTLRWAAAYAGCVNMRFPGHPEWEISG